MKDSPAVPGIPELQGSFPLLKDSPRTPVIPTGVRRGQISGCLCPSVGDPQETRQDAGEVLP